MTELRYHCVTHDNVVKTPMPEWVINPLDGVVYTPTYCKGDIYDREGPTCVFLWQYPNNKRLVYVSIPTKDFPARKIRGTNRYSRTFANSIGQLP